VDNRERRRDGDLVLTIVRVAFDRAVEGRFSDFPAAVGSMRRSAGGLRFLALADALGAFWNMLRFGMSAFWNICVLEYPPKDFSSAPCSQLRRPFSLRRCGISWSDFAPSAGSWMSKADEPLMKTVSGQISQAQA